MFELLIRDTAFLGVLAATYFYLNLEFSQLKKELSRQRKIHVHLHDKGGAEKCTKIHSMCFLNADLEDCNKLHSQYAPDLNIELDVSQLSDSSSEPELIENVDGKTEVVVDLAGANISGDESTEEEPLQL